MYNYRNLDLCRFFFFNIKSTCTYINYVGPSDLRGPDKFCICVQKYKKYLNAQAKTFDFFPQIIVYSQTYPTEKVKCIWCVICWHQVSLIYFVCFQFCERHTSLKYRMLCFRNFRFSSNCGRRFHFLLNIHCFYIIKSSAFSIFVIRIV